MGELIIGVFLACILVGLFQTWRKFMRARRRYHAYCMCAVYYHNVTPASFEDFCRYENIEGHFTGPVWAASFDLFRGAIK